MAKKPPQVSEFDDKLEKNKYEAERDAALKAVTIDDDQPDYEKEDEYGESRVHCWVMMQKGNREIYIMFSIKNEERLDHLYPCFPAPPLL